MARFEIPDGWTVQAFQFALDCTGEQAACVRRQFGGRRYARNWAVRTLKEDLARYRETGEETGAPSLAGLRKRWNRVKDTECVDADTGQVWWPQISKEAAPGAGPVTSATTTPPLTSRYEPLTTGDSALGPVRAAVKRGADRKTRPRRAGGNETRKGTSRQAGKQPRDGVLMGGSP
jgi:hypothetical protein